MAAKSIYEMLCPGGCWQCCSKFIRTSKNVEGLTRGSTVKVFSSRLAIFYIGGRQFICYWILKNFTVFCKSIKTNEEAKTEVPKAARNHKRKQDLDFLV